MKTRAPIFAFVLLALSPCMAQVRVENHVAPVAREEVSAGDGLKNDRPEMGGVGFKSLPLWDTPIPNFTVDEPLSAIEERLLKREGYLFSPPKNDRALRPLSVIERELAPVQRVVRQNAGPVFIGNRIVFNRAGSEEADGQNEGGANPAAPVLEFADGSRLHGALEGLDGAKREIVWRGVEASAALTFPLGQVSHFEFPSPAKSVGKVRATVKLTGGDWLAADVTGLRDGRLHLKLGDGTALAVERAHLEWVYFSKTAAPECYDGPHNLSGWVSGGGWSYREGALRAAQPTAIGRMFGSLPDRVEYRFEFDQGAGATRTFAVLLHGTEAAGRNLTTGMVRLMVNDANFTLWSQLESGVKQEQVDLSKILPALAKAADSPLPAPASRKPMRWRIFEDRPSGRLVVFIDGRKVGDWNLGKGKAGANRGSFTFQPMTWSANTEQSLAKIRVLPWDGFVPVDDAFDEMRRKTDQVVLTDGDMENGRIESMTGDKVQLGAGRDCTGKNRAAAFRAAGGGAGRGSGGGAGAAGARRGIRGGGDRPRWRKAAPADELWRRAGARNGGGARGRVCTAHAGRGEGDGHARFPKRRPAPRLAGIRGDWPEAALADRADDSAGGDGHGADGRRTHCAARGAACGEAGGSRAVLERRFRGRGFCVARPRAAHAGERRGGPARAPARHGARALFFP